MVEIGVKALLGSLIRNSIFSKRVCQTQAALLKSTREHQPDVVVCGLSRESELGGIQELQAAAPGTRIVLWARDVSTELAHQSGGSGSARGFFEHHAGVGGALPRVPADCGARGELWMESALTMNLLNNRPISLSKRQSELVGLLVQGLKNKEIASALGISEGTVKAYLTTLYEKVGARDRFELALFDQRIPVTPRKCAHREPILARWWLGRPEAQ